MAFDQRHGANTLEFHQMSRTHTKLPVGPNPGWELDVTDEDGISVDLKSVSDRCVLFPSFWLDIDCSLVA